MREAAAEELVAMEAMGTLGSQEWLVWMQTVTSAGPMEGQAVLVVMEAMQAMVRMQVQEDLCK